MDATLPISLVAGELMDGLLRRLANGPLLVGLDFDGTLAPIVDRPQQAGLTASMRARLTRLAALVPTAVVSGRDLDDLHARVGVPGMSLAGSHGVEIAFANGRTERADGLDRSDAQLPELIERLRRATAALPGVLVEPKRHSVAVHWRLAAPADREIANRAVAAAARDMDGFRRINGKMVAELRPAVDRDKGGALALLRHVMTGEDGPPSVLYAGDDITDEDAFRVLDPARDAGILVAEVARPSAAAWRVDDTAALGRVLDQLIALRSDPARITP
jgi:trehalose-phosphatase